MLFGSPTRGQYILSASKLAETAGVGASGGHFIGFDLFFKTNFPIELHLDETADAVDNAGDTSPNKNKGMENAARIGFVNQGEVLLSSGLTGTALSTAAQTLKYVTDQNGTNITVWEPNFDHHTPATKQDVQNMFAIPIGDPMWGSRLDYDGIREIIPIATPILLKQANVTGDGIRSTNYFRNIPVSQVVTTQKGTPRASTVDTTIRLNAGITKFRIYMWLEGQDYDCGDTASGSNVKFDLILKAIKI